MIGRSMESIPKDMLSPRSQTDFDDPFFLDPIWHLYDTQVAVYLLSLAAVQRGLEVTHWGSAQAAKSTKMTHLKWDKPRLFTVSDGKRTHFFDLTQGDRTTVEAARIAKDKEATKAALEKHGVKSPSGMLVDGKNRKKVKDFLSGSKAKHFITKPQTGSLSKNIGRNMTADRVLRLIDRTSDARFIVEEQIEGPEYRAFVVGDHMSAAFERKPAIVIGNGRDTIAQLIAARNKNRASRPHWVNRQIDIAPVAAWLSKSGISLHSVPVFGKTVVLSPDMNVRRGGRYIDVTFEFPKVAAEAAIAANRALGLPNSGMDLIIQDGVPYILEVNTRAQIQMHVLQEVGKNLDNSVPEAIIDAYFPAQETIVRDLDLGVDAKGLQQAFEKDGYDTEHKIVPVRRAVQK